MQKLEKNFGLGYYDRMSKYRVLLYYQYVPIEDPEDFRDHHRVLCQRLGIKGRILIASEGINGTCEGTVEATEEYMRVMHADERFADMVFKESEGNGKAFPKLKVKVRPEIVTTRWGKEIDPETDRAQFLEPEELHQWYREDRDDFVVVDMRNNYEVEGGHFEKTVHPDMNNFRDLGDKLKNIEHLKKSDKKLVAVCNGNIRCEKASAFLVQQGFENVYHLHHGIHTYMQKYPGKDFKGTLYVFDDRKTMQFAGPEVRGVTGHCRRCQQSSERYENCARSECARNFIVCDDCADQGVYCNSLCQWAGERKLKIKKPLRWYNLPYEYVRQKVGALLPTNRD